MSENSVNQLRNLLSIIAEESVRSAYEQEKEYQEKIANGGGLDEAPEDDEEEKGDMDDVGGDENDPLFGDEPDPSGAEAGGDEVDPEAGGDDLGGDDMAGGDAGGDMDPGMGDEDQEQKAGDAPTEKVGYVQSPLTLELGKVTVEGVGATLNMIRAGRSYKDADVAQQLDSWFTSLSQAEQLALATFLEALKDIAEGSDATQSPDPSDPSIGLQIASKDDAQVRPGGVQKAGDPDPQQAQGQPGQPSMQAKQTSAEGPDGTQIAQTTMGVDPEEDQEDLEDTNAPIIVGRRHESVQNNDFRMKIREMLTK